MTARPPRPLVAMIAIVALVACDPNRPSELGQGFVSTRCVTSFGSFTINVDTLGAPEASANFLSYLDAGFFDGRDQRDATIVERIEPRRRVILGRMLIDGRLKRAEDPIVNESDNGVSNARGTVAAYWTDDPDSATAGFAVNLSDNPDLDGGPAADGYAVFGLIDPGMLTFDAMNRANLNPNGSPRVPIMLNDCHRM